MPIVIRSARQAMVICLCTVGQLTTMLPAAERPNIVLVMSDDQGYGDISCHGNKELSTPAIDTLRSESVALTNFHVDPTCSPTRSALMTGKYSHRVGVWHTIRGRSLLPTNEITMAEHFSAAGYETAIFGKWHLGDSYPLRPQDQGFKEVLVHGGGGVGQTPDHWGNDYFDDTYCHNGEWKPYTGYCTDVWFREAQHWLTNRDGEKPFFLYIPTNAPHSPYLVADEYAQPFRDAGIPSPRAEFYGMIANLDQNIGALRAFLSDNGLSENTIFIFMTDNGTAAGHLNGGFNAGMRGSKNTAYEGGHRVPCFIHWPQGKLNQAREINQLAAHFDLLPTLAKLAHVELKNSDQLDGIDLSTRLLQSDPIPRDRTLVVESQRIDRPQPWQKTSVMRGPWRLVNRNELYNLEDDPGQQHNIANDHPDLVAELTRAYESWWDDVSTNDQHRVPIVLGADGHLETNLTAHDWQPLADNDRGVPWSQQQAYNQDPKANGRWTVRVDQPGRYQFELRTRPAPHEVPLQAASASIGIAQNVAEMELQGDEKVAKIDLELPAGDTTLLTRLVDADGSERGAYFVSVTRLADE